MASTTTSHGGMLLATAMAVSGTVALLAFGIQKSTDDFLVNTHRQSFPATLPPRSCLSSGGSKKEKKKKRRVHFAVDVVDPIRNNEEYRKKIQPNYSNKRVVHHRAAYSS